MDTGFDRAVPVSAVKVFACVDAGGGGGGGTLALAGSHRLVDRYNASLVESEVALNT